MSNSVNKIPSINIPFVDKKGRISPIWYEYLRFFIASTTESTDSNNPILSDNLIAGAGLRKVEADGDTTLSVGAGSGITVNADDVNVDISSQQSIPLDLTDELLFSDVSDNNNIRKTTVNDIVSFSSASPGGVAFDIQYNDGAEGFEGNTGFTYDGVSAVEIGEVLTIDGAEFATATNATKFVFNVPAGTTTTHYLFRQTASSGSSDMPARYGSALASTELHIDNDLDAGGSTTSTSTLKFDRTGSTKWTMGLDGSGAGSNFILSLTQLNTGIIFKVDGTTNNMSMSKPFFRYTEATITASTTQTQGQRPLTKDINEISTCANANDTVTLPIALEGRHCLVINNGAQTLQIFPASGDNLGAGLNTSTTLAAGGRSLFIAYDSTNWEPVL